MIPGRLRYPDRARPQSVIRFRDIIGLDFFRLALLALLPNLWPVVGVFGYMGWVGVPLDIASVMTASVVLGLAVDDSIHTLGHFRRLAPVHGSRAAVEETLFATAPAYVLTACILIAGKGHETTQTIGTQVIDFDDREHARRALAARAD